MNPEVSRLIKTAPTYSPTLHRSTIGVSELNFSVRNGKRWNLTAKSTWIRLDISKTSNTKPYNSYIIQNMHYVHSQKHRPCGSESFGQLVRLGFDVAVFTPASYQRHRLWRPYKRRSNLVAGFALRCFQRLSDPDLDTRRCTWRHNRLTRGRSDTVLSY